MASRSEPLAKVAFGLPGGLGAPLVSMGPPPLPVRPPVAERDFADPLSGLLDAPASPPPPPPPQGKIYSIAMQLFISDLRF
jgi:hypothetical protein